MCYQVGQTKVGFQIKKVSEILFFFRALVFYAIKHHFRMVWAFSNQANSLLVGG